MTSFFSDDESEVYTAKAMALSEVKRDSLEAKELAADPICASAVATLLASMGLAAARVVGAIITS